MTGLQVPTKDGTGARDVIVRGGAERLRGNRSRLLLVLVISLAVHALLIAYLRVHDMATEPLIAPLSATLVPIPPPAAPALPRPTARSSAMRAPVYSPVTMEPAPTPLAQITPDAPASSLADGAAGSGPGAAAPQAAASSSAQANAAAPGAAPPATVAASAVLHYNVLAKDPQRDQNQGYGGVGTLDWKLDGGRYSLDFSIKAIALVFRFSFLQSHSSGSVDANGLIPQRYSEQLRQNAPRTPAFPVAGTGRRLQDRASVIIQLGAMLRANPALAQAGTELGIDVLALDGAIENWQFKVVGSEIMHTDAGNFPTVHVARVLRAGSHDRGIELWLTPERSDYPVRILYTEPDHSYIDLRLTDISQTQ